MSGPTDIIMKANGYKIRSMDMESTITSMSESIKDISRMIRCMVKESSLEVMANHIKAYGRKAYTSRIRRIA